MNKKNEINKLLCPGVNLKSSVQSLKTVQYHEPKFFPFLIIAKLS